MDAGQQPPLAPFGVGRLGGEASLQDEPFGLERASAPGSIFCAGNRKVCASTAAVVGPTACSRPRTISISAASKFQLRAANSAGACERGVDAPRSIHRARERQLLGSNPEARPIRRTSEPHVRPPMSASSCACQPARVPSSSVTTPSNISASCSSSSFSIAGHASSRTVAIACGSRRPRSAAVSGSSQRRDATACVRRSSSGASSRYAYGRALRISCARGDGCGRSRATTALLAVLEGREHATSPSMSIASCRQSCSVCRTSGWSGISRSPAQVFGTGNLIGEHHGDQILRRHALQRRRRFLAALRASHGERDARVPAPARREERRIEHRLHQHRFDRAAVEVTRDLLEREAVGLAERQYDRVLGRRRLQFEVERAAEALAQRETEGAVDARAEGRMDDELHAARLVEEALEDQRVLRRQAAEHRLRRRRGSRRSARRRMRSACASA